MLDHLIYLPLIAILTQTFLSGQQSEATTLVIFSYQPRTRHLPHLDATANVQLQSPTNLTLPRNFLFPHSKKKIQIRLLAVLSVLTVIKKGKSQVSLRPSCLKTTKRFLTKCQFDTLPSLQKTPGVIYDLGVRKSN